MSAPNLGFWARIGGVVASIFLKGDKKKQQALEISDRVGRELDDADDRNRR